MEASILAVETAVPSFCVPQTEIAEKVIALLGLDEIKAAEIRQLYQNSAINTRYSVIPDFLDAAGQKTFFGEDYPKSIPGMFARNEIYKTEAPKLAFEAAKKAIIAWGGDPQSITHVISVSCTGVVAPGIEFQLIKLLNLKWSTERLGINLMGCFGAFKGLSIARSLAKDNPKNRVLVVCTELCSLHFQAEQTPDNLLANSLFADGAAAVVVGVDLQPWETPHWFIRNKASLGVDDTTERMRWEASDYGFFMKLSKAVPVLLGRCIQPFIDTLLGKGLSCRDCDWAIHPGGKSIIQAIEKKIGLNLSHTQVSWEILSEYGNMSSATVLFVLKRLLERGNPKKWTCGVGFGPGLSLEGFLLERVAL